MSLLLVLNRFHTLNNVSIVDFEHILAVWVRSVSWKYLFLNFNNIKRNNYLQNSSNTHLKKFLFIKIIGLQPSTMLKDEFLSSHFFNDLSTFQNTHFKKPLRAVAKQTYTKYTHRKK